MSWVLTICAGYLLGSVPVAVWWARRHGVDLYATGDGNPGAWNAREQLGGRRALPVFLGDGLKGLAAGLLGHLLVGKLGGAYAGVAAAMLGHCFPLFSRLRGGKAVMTFGGGAFALSPVAALICLAALGVVAALRSFDLGVKLAVFGFPLVQLPFDGGHRVAWTGALMSIIGLRFLVIRRSSRATSARASPPTA